MAGRRAPWSSAWGRGRAAGAWAPAGSAVASWPAGAAWSASASWGSAAWVGLAGLGSITKSTPTPTPLGPRVGDDGGEALDAARQDGGCVDGNDLVADLGAVGVEQSEADGGGDDLLVADIAQGTGDQDLGRVVGRGLGADSPRTGDRSDSRASRPWRRPRRRADRDRRPRPGTARLPPGWRRRRWPEPPTRRRASPRGGRGAAPRPGRGRPWAVLAQASRPGFRAHRCACRNQDRLQPAPRRRGPRPLPTAPAAPRPGSRARRGRRCGSGRDGRPRRSPRQA